MSGEYETQSKLLRVIREFLFSCSILISDSRLEEQIWINQEGKLKFVSCFWFPITQSKYEENIFERKGEKLRDLAGVSSFLGH